MRSSKWRASRKNCVSLVVMASSMRAQLVLVLDDAPVVGAVALQAELADPTQEARGDERELDVAEVDARLPKDDALEQPELALLERLDVGAAVRRARADDGEGVAHEVASPPAPLRRQATPGAAVTARDSGLAEAMSSAADSTLSMSRMWTNFLPTLPIPTM